MYRRENNDNAVKLEFDVEWQSFDDYGRQRYSGYPVHTKTALVSQVAVNNSNMKVGESPWVWDRTVNGIPAGEERPLRAMVTMTIVDTNKARAGSTTTHQLNLNPQITVIPQSLTVSEGNDSHATFGVFLDPPALETTTVQYATSDGTATAGSDYTATSGTLTFSVGDEGKLIQVPITNDAVSDSGETFEMTLSNASGATRILFAQGGVTEFVNTLSYSITILNDEPGDNPNSDDVSLVTITAESAPSPRARKPCSN